MTTTSFSDALDEIERLRAEYEAEKKALALVLQSAGSAENARLRAENAKLRDEIAALRPLESLATKLSDTYDLPTCVAELRAFARTWTAK